MAESGDANVEIILFVFVLILVVMLIFVVIRDYNARHFDRMTDVRGKVDPFGRDKLDLFGGNLSS